MSSWLSFNAICIRSFKDITPAEVLDLRPRINAFLCSFKETDLALCVTWEFSLSRKSLWSNKTAFFLELVRVLLSKFLSNDVSLLSSHSSVVALISSCVSDIVSSCVSDTIPSCVSDIVSASSFIDLIFLLGISKFLLDKKFKMSSLLLFTKLFPIVSSVLFSRKISVYRTGSSLEYFRCGGEFVFADKLIFRVSVNRESKDWVIISFFSPDLETWLDISLMEIWMFTFFWWESFIFSFEISAACWSLLKDCIVSELTLSSGSVSLKLDFTSVVFNKSRLGSSSLVVSKFFIALSSFGEGLGDGEGEVLS